MNHVLHLRPYKRAALALTALLLVGGVLRMLYLMGGSVPAGADYAALPTIIIDPGHGGVDGGAVGADEIVEKDINLAIGLTLRDLFTINGFPVVMTRETDESIHDEGITSVRKQKVSDLHNRLDLTKEYPNAILISVHQNKFSDSRSRGAQIFCGPQNENSEKLGLILQESFARNLQPENTRQHKTAGKNLFLLYNAECPAVLVECGFLSNAEEAHLLIDAEYQDKIAFTVFASVMDFLEMDAPTVLPETEAVAGMWSA